MINFDLLKFFHQLALTILKWNLFVSCLEKPKIDILPYDVTGRIERITYENLNEEVFLFLVGDEDETI